MQQYKCPVCGKHDFSEDEDYSFCPVCGWANAQVQRDDYDYWGGANDMSVKQAREAYKAGKEIC